MIIKIKNIKNNITIKSIVLSAIHILFFIIKEYLGN